MEITKTPIKTSEGGVPALAVDAENGHGILDIDLRQYSRVEHTHDEFIKKEEAEDGNIRFDVLFSGNAKTRDASYLLNKPVTDYRFLFIFGAEYHSGLQKFGQKNSVLIECNDIEFGDTGSGWTIMFNGGKEMGGAFTDDTTFIPGLGVPKEWAYVAVRKIIGIY